jgi:hypothetical protein
MPYAPEGAKGVVVAAAAATAAAAAVAAAAAYVALFDHIHLYILNSYMLHFSMIVPTRC